MLAQTGVPAQSASFFLFSLYAGGAAEMTSYAASARIQSDDRMDLEFTAARAMYAPPNGNARALRAIADGARQPVAIAAQMRAARAGDWAARGDAALKAEAFEMASDSFRRAAALDTASFDAYRGGVTAAAGAGKLAEQSERLRNKAGEEPDNAAVRTAVSYSLALAGDMEGAVAAAIEATRLDPDSPQPLEQLASVFADLGDPRLGPVAETLVTRFPDRGEGRYYRGAALFMQNDREEAKAEIDRLLEINPRHAKASNLRGIMCATQGDHTCAIAAFEASLKGDPRDATVYVNLGNAHLERGDVERAIGYFSEALVIDPTAETAREALRALGVAH